MKNFSYLLTFLFLSIGITSNAQTTTGTPSASYGILENKLKKSDEGVTDPKKNITPKFWLSRAELLMEIFDVNRQYLTNGAIPTQVKLFFNEPKEIKTRQEEGFVYDDYIYDRITITFKNGVLDSFKETVKIHPDPLHEALSSISKAKELDIEHKNDKAIAENYVRIKEMLQRQGVEFFVDKDYSNAFKDFSSIIKIDSFPEMEGKFDTLICYYTGMAASNAGMTQAAIDYYELARKYNSKEADLPVFLKRKYFEAGDTAKGVTILEEGFKANPDNQAIVIELINYYLLAGKAEAALNYLKIAQEDDPGNLSFIFAEGTLYDKMGETDKALATYQKCIDQDPNYFNAYYNIGVMFYNKAVKMFADADNIKTQKDYDIAKIAADATLAKAVPYMEKAHEIQPEEESTMQTLKTLYLRLKMTDKYNAIVLELEN